jgi:NADH-quinone oxidoreductase subunit M
MYGPVTNEKNKKLPDLYAREWAYFLPLIILAFWIGLYPKPVLDYIGKPVQTIVRQVRPDYASGGTAIRAQTKPVEAQPVVQAEPK